MALRRWSKAKHAEYRSKTLSKFLKKWMIRIERRRAFLDPECQPLYKKYDDCEI